MLALGTVSLGMDYGIRMPGDFGQPVESDVIRILQKATSLGVNLFDTAPAYGNSEELVGRALGRRKDCYLATKVAVPRDAEGQLVRGNQLQLAIRNSIERSLRALDRDLIDIIQIHNADIETIARGEITESLLKAREEGKISWIGASVYGEQAALAALETGSFDLLQVAYNLLDQRMSKRVFPSCQEANVGLITRSALLKGALTSKSRWLPAELQELTEAVGKLRRITNDSWQEFPQTALRFCLSTPIPSSVLVGVRKFEELEQAVRAAQRGPVRPELLAQVASVAAVAGSLTDPSHWPIP